MSRRDMNRTDTSIISVTDSLKSLMATSSRYAGDLTGLTFLDETTLRQYGPEQILYHMLSTKCFISTTSSAALRNQDAHDNADLQAFKQIGQGQCGTVWALVGTTRVFKAVNPGKKDQLWNDCCMHKRVECSFNDVFLEFRQDISIPHLVDWFHPSNTLFWNQNGPLFPQGFKATYGIMSARIYPLPLPVREAIVDAFAPKSIKSNKVAFLAESANKDCLVRLYLGRRAQRSSSNAFRLRNFDLMVNEMEFLRLDTEMYAKVMAQALAVLHWKANVDANDVEFVLGSAPQERPTATLQEFEASNPDDARFIGQDLNFRKRAVGIWLFDFDQCRRFQENEVGLKQLERSFFFNDPYYPRPGSKDPKDISLWGVFKNQYLYASARLTNSSMPKRFIDAVEGEGNKRSVGGSLFQ